MFCKLLSSTRNYTFAFLLHLCKSNIVYTHSPQVNCTIVIKQISFTRSYHERKLKVSETHPSNLRNDSVISLLTYVFYATFVRQQFLQVEFSNTGKFPRRKENHRKQRKNHEISTRDSLLLHLPRGSEYLTRGAESDDTGENDNYSICDVIVDVASSNPFEVCGV